MMDSIDSERMSICLSSLLEREFTGTKEQLYIRQRSVVLGDHFEQHKVICGSLGEGLRFQTSDKDRMLTDKTVAVMYPNQHIPRKMAGKTIFYIRDSEADCRPGYVHLELGQIGQGPSPRIVKSLFRVGNASFLSSDNYRELFVTEVGDALGVNHESNGPSCTFKMAGVPSSMDLVMCFRCYSWPKEADGWRQRTRLHGWPSQTLIDSVVEGGFALVPVGDKCSKNPFFQWRVSFVKAERSLIHSFTHIQFKVYALLKYFLTQIKDTLAKDIGDDDILCSYFLKTAMFHAIENTSKTFWQEKNLFYCFWFCVNLLITWVRAGYCPNYFIPANNLFKRKIHGQHQQILLDILKKYSQMKWMCLSFGYPTNSLWEKLLKASIQVVPEIVITQDQEVFNSLLVTDFKPNRNTMMKAINVLSTSQSDFDDFYTYQHAVRYLHDLATDQVYPDHMAATDNKTRYRTLRKCKHWMIPTASMGTELLYLATFYFLLGNFGKALHMCRQVTKLASRFGLQAQFEGVHLQSGHILDRLRTLYTWLLCFYDRGICLPHLCLEAKALSVVPPLPYAVFLTFLCCHELGDIRGRAAALRHLRQVQGDNVQGGHRHWIVHTLLGICYEMLGDNQRAIKTYWDSAQSKTLFYGKNPAIKRIAIVYLCMYASQRTGRR